MTKNYGKDKREFEKSVGILQEAKHRREMVQNELSHLIKELNMLAAEMERFHNEALHDVEQFGINKINPEKLGALIQGLNSRKEMWETKQGRKTILEKKLIDINALHGIKTRAYFLIWKRFWR
jgi:hypothetical protein